MMTMGQKLLAIVALVFIELVAFVFFPLMGFVGLFFAIPLAIIILKR